MGNIFDKVREAIDKKEELPSGPIESNGFKHLEKAHEALQKRLEDERNR